MLAYKLLDAVYMIGLRIGEEMARSLLTEFCSDFFAAFDKVHNNTNGEENNELNLSVSGYEACFFIDNVTYVSVNHTHCHMFTVV